MSLDENQLDVALEQEINELLCDESLRDCSDLARQYMRELLRKPKYTKKNTVLRNEKLRIVKGEALAWEQTERYWDTKEPFTRIPTSVAFYNHEDELIREYRQTLLFRIDLFKNGETISGLRTKSKRILNLEETLESSNHCILKYDYKTSRVSDLQMHKINQQWLLDFTLPLYLDPFVASEPNIIQVRIPATELSIRRKIPLENGCNEDNGVMTSLSKIQGSSFLAMLKIVAPLSEGMTQRFLQADFKIGKTETPPVSNDDTVV